MPTVGQHAQHGSIIYSLGAHRYRRTRFPKLLLPPNGLRGRLAVGLIPGSPGRSC